MRRASLFGRVVLDDKRLPAGRRLALESVCVDDPLHDALDVARLRVIIWQDFAAVLADRLLERLLAHLDLHRRRHVHEPPPAGFFDSLEVQDVVGSAAADEDEEEGRADVGFEVVPREALSRVVAVPGGSGPEDRREAAPPALLLLLSPEHFHHGEDVLGVEVLAQRVVPPQPAFLTLLLFCGISGRSSPRRFSESPV